MKTFTRLSLIVLSVLITGLETFAQTPDDGPMGQDQVTFYEPATTSPTRDLNPVIVNALNEINSDSIRATIQHLQDYGTRFLMLDSRKTIATWIADQFSSYGIADVRLDSFLCYINWSGVYVDTLWQYNVVATIPGQSAPSEIYVVGGHYDSYCSPDPYTYAPGADDNGTAVAATLEIARVMQLNNYQPEATIQFTLFAAEELGLFGSRYQAQKAYETGEDVRFMLNLDMISNDPDSLDIVTIFRYQFFEWASILAADVIEQYTYLDAVFSNSWNSGGSDSRGYWEWGFPSTYLEEYDFSPNWHKPTDIIDNCNIDFCAEITRGACAILMTQQFLPYPQGMMATSTKENITVAWDPTENALIDGFNLYRSEEMNGVYEKMNQVLIADTFYLDTPSETGKDYFYFVRMVNNQGEESMASDKVWGARFGFTDTLLVVASLNQTSVTPDSVYQFYASILDTIPFTWFDLNATTQLPLGLLASHQNVLWLQNGFNAVTPTDTLGFNLYSFFQNGGNMFVSGFIPTKFWANNTHYPFKFPEEYFISRIFKIDSVDKQINSFMYKAYPSAEEYDTLHVDQGKSLTPEFPGELFNIEVFSPTAEGSVIYRFDSRWDPASSQGRMQNRPVAIEYMGDDFKTIFMSFPLYYLDTADARNLMQYIMKYKFNDPTGIGPRITPSDVTLFQNYPNPFSDETTIPFVVDKPSRVNLSVFTLQGIRVTQLIDSKLEKGFYNINFSSSHLPSGLYQVVLQTDRSLSTRKIVLIR
ncbi:MAG: M20/M25/M40 family metallo-hydrolase [Bacteroidales bacterium]|nr:M20/M25/M40 family metallo-hydrolase [Bacteroidales bacterium]